MIVDGKRVNRERAREANVITIKWQFNLYRVYDTQTEASIAMKNKKGIFIILAREKLIVIKEYA
jgi:hypothetical protein